MEEQDKPASCSHCGCFTKIFGLDFNLQADNSVSTSLQSDELLQGYQGMIHGGILSALLDSAMANCLLKQGIEGVTGELRVRYHQPVSCKSLLTIRASISESLPPLYHLKASIEVGGTIYCKAKARFMARDKSLESLLPQNSRQKMELL